jgi:hypothetical protein
MMQLLPERDMLRYNSCFVLCPWGVAFWKATFMLMSNGVSSANVIQDELTQFGFPGSVIFVSIMSLVTKGVQLYIKCCIHKNIKTQSAKFGRELSTCINLV